MLVNPPVRFVEADQVPALFVSAAMRKLGKSDLGNCGFPWFESATAAPGVKLATSVPLAIGSGLR